MKHIETNNLNVAQIIQWALLVTFAIVSLYPLIFMAISSFKDNREFYSNFWGLSSEFRWNNYAEVAPNVLTWIRNTLVYSTVNAVVVVAITSLSGYGFARFKFPAKEVLFTSLLVFMMLPGILLVVPMYVMVTRWGMSDSIWALVLPWTAVQVPIGTLVMRRFFQTQPSALFDAAFIDGASQRQVFVLIALPLAAPAISTVAILDVVFSSNDLIWPMLVMQSRETMPLAVGVLSYSGARGAITWGNVFAAYTLASIPLIIMFVFLGRSFANALTHGAIK